MTLTPTTWNRVFADNDLAGCLMECAAGQFVCCGPLAKVWEDGFRIYLLLPWLAQLSSEDGEWHYIGGNFWMVSMAGVTPSYTTDGCIAFEVPLFGDCMIIPKHLRQLDGKRVLGMPSDPDRLTAFYLRRSGPQSESPQFVRA